ncbi:hypothetical protein CROQUDRAFT_104386 [Cronartium quercuum f. sp. fusiforme G11]|uniref:Galactose oxidase n=1 Tax=Cronartium quercuum f. sp. fusiforme G11 TaxID=708437 RepID=A0A9P6TF52_9BASI|nr:hypothetical protein CROQUDRAFT_104386 [Cronartium quercuum f. sp. fusiforme G11]
MRPIYANSAHHSQSLLALISTFTAVLAQLDLSHYASQPRWGQASIPLSDNSLLVYGGKVTGNGGYTYSSAPDTNDLLYLTLNSSFPAASPPWQYLAGSQLPTTTSGSQPVSYTALGLLVPPTPSSPGTILAFGGAAPLSSNLSESDSSWLISLPSLPSTPQSNSALITQQSPSWAQQPIRRIRHTAISATNSDSLRVWVLGGQRADGSQTVLDELWQYSASLASPQLGVWSACPSTPRALFDHASAAIVDSKNVVRIYVMGGVSRGGQLVPTDVLYRFTPDLTSSTTCAGVWDTLNVAGSSHPSGRRGHSIVALSATQLMLFGGASASASTVYSDLWILDLDHLSWSQLQADGATGAPSARWGQSMTRVGQRVVIAFGYGPIDSSRPAPVGVGVFDLDSGTWADTYVPSDTTSISTSMASSNVLSVPGQTTGTGAGSITTSSNAPASWQIPGFHNPAKTVPVSPSSTTTASHASGSVPLPTTTTIIGIAVAILGALALVAGSVYFHRYHKQQKITRQLEAEEYRRRAFGPDLPMADDDDQLGLVDNKNESLHATHASVVKPVGLKTFVGAFWAVGRGKKERFDMLADEESEIWSPSPARRRRDYRDGFADRVRLPVPMSMGETDQQRQDSLPLVTTRGGLRIWRGLDECSTSQIGFGTSTSFLGASLAPWSDDGRSPSIPAVSSFEDPFDDAHAPAYPYRQRPSQDSLRSDVQNPFSDDEEEARSEHTAFTYHSSQPESSAHCSSTDPPGPSTPPTQTLLPAPKPLERKGTWWDRLRDKHVSLDPLPIRDPAPPPLIPPPTQEVQVHVIVVDEHGRHGTEPEPEKQSATKSSNRSVLTATSSMVEAAAAEMTVVQRIGSVDNSPVLESSSTFGVSPRIIGPRELPPMPVRRQTAGAVGVRAMVEAFETSGAVGDQLGNQPKRVKVVHDLVKKPVLFVANPDK